MAAPLDREQAKQIVLDLLAKAHDRFKQEFAGENEEFLDRIVCQYRAKVARHSWKASQKWCKWNDDGPVLMPDYTRLYYRKGNTEIVVLEYPPQVRLMKFAGSLALRASTDERVSDADAARVLQYSLALPYVVFLFKYTNGVFVEVRCAFCDRPLRRLEERPLRPYLSNIDNALLVCLGRSFDRAQLVKDDIVQQTAFILSHFWQSTYSDEWSYEFWKVKEHFQTFQRMATMEAWQAASVENPLFVVEDVGWLPHAEETFGDMIVRLFDDDAGNLQLHEELYTELVETFLRDVTKTVQENLDAIEEKVVADAADALADDLLARLAEAGA